MKLNNTKLCKSSCIPDTCNATVAFVANTIKKDHNYKRSKQQTCGLFKSKQNAVDLRSFIVLPFLLINIVGDIIGYSNHIFSSLVTIWVVVSIVATVFVKYPEVFTGKLIAEIDECNPATFSYLTIIKWILHVLLFWWEADVIVVFAFVLQLAVHTLIAVSFFISYNETTLFKMFNRKMNCIKSEGIGTFESD